MGKVKKSECSVVDFAAQSCGPRDKPRGTREFALADSARNFLRADMHTLQSGRARLRQYSRYQLISSDLSNPVRARPHNGHRRVQDEVLDRQVDDAPPASASAKATKNPLGMR